MLQILQIIIVLSSLILGIILKKIAKQETKQYKKYLEISEKVILLILILTLLSLKFNYYMILTFVLGYFLIFNIQFYLGFSLLLSFLINQNYNFLISSLIFIFNLIYARNITIKKIPIYLVFFIMPFILFFFKEFVMQNINLFLSFTAGALFRNLVKFK